LVHGNRAVDSVTAPVQRTLFPEPPAEPFKLLPLDEYDIIAVSYSGGKDSLACLLHLLDLGVPRSKIELHHNDVDGRGEPLMDWPCTPAYVKATVEALGIPVVFSWREGGFVREMLRYHAPTAPVSYEREGQRVTLPTVRATEGTRLKFPQVSADLSVRWCSAYLKIDPFARVLNNDPAYQAKKILVVTGERGQESSARAKYEIAEPHRCNSKTRTVHQWRPILNWKEEQVWEIIERWRVRPHPAYALGWGRTSCLACIFGNEDQWASVNQLDPERFRRIADLERQFGVTIKKGQSVEDMAQRGQEFVTDKPEELRRLAMTPDAFTSDLFFLPEGEVWKMPAGAYKRCGGPT
jgi:3'-phosphoadenosine 5'-phosphosulfate sulfotransferase (PAPS reductase)/FAD synthetase